jgi:hypothetical protein
LDVSPFTDCYNKDLPNCLSLQNVYVEITNAHGSTVTSPVVVQASVMRGFESLLPQRLKQIAQTIRGSARKNLGLNNGVFGKVKEIRLSSFLKDTLHAYPPAPAPAPAPSPQLTDHSEPFISPYHSPSYSPISPVTVETPCFDCEVSSPSPSIVTEHSPAYSPVASPPSYTASHTAGVAPDLSRRVVEVSHGFKLRQDDERSNKLVSHLLAPSSPCKFI